MLEISAENLNKQLNRKSESTRAGPFGHRISSSFLWAEVDAGPEIFIIIFESK
jgi:hypothetical protein